MSRLSASPALLALVAVACTSSGPVGPKLSSSEAEVAFAEVVIGEHQDLSVVISNGGTAATGTLEASLSGGDEEDFTLGADTCSGGPLSAEASCTLRVRFAPSASGDRATTLVVDDGNGLRLSLVVSGRGRNPPALFISPSQHDFGEGELNFEGAPVTFTVRNGGTAHLELLPLLVSGDDSEDFVRDDDGCSGETLAPGATCTVKVRFRPSSLGERTGILSALTRSGEKADAALVGTGVELPPFIELEPESLGFGGVAVGGLKGMVIHVLNETQDVSGEVSIALEGPDADAFSFSADTCTGYRLNAEDFCTVGLVFEPKRTGAHTATFAATARPGGRVTTSLTGAGLVPAQLSTDEASLTFPTVAVDTRAQRTLTVTNGGEETTGVLTTRLDGPGAEKFELEDDQCNGATLAGGASCEVTIAFEPTVIGDPDATFVVSASPGGEAQVALSGEAVAAAALDVGPAGYDFGWVERNGGEATFDFSVTNVGGVPSGAVQVQLTGTGAGHFAIEPESDCSDPLPAGSSCTVRVAFRPTADGAIEAQLRLEAAPGGSASAMVTGTGVAPSFLTRDPTALAFGTQPEGTSSATRTVTFRNSGHELTGLVMIELQGTDSGQFSVTENGCIDATLNPDETCAVTVAFAPQARGSFHAFLTATATPGGIAPVSLAGTGVMPARVAAASVIEELGTTVVGSVSESRRLTFRNDGEWNTGALTVSLLAGGGSQFTLEDDGCSGNSLEGGGTCTVDVRHTPSAAGSHVDGVRVESAYGGAATTQVSGTGVAPAELSSDRAAIDFGSIAHDGSSTVQTVTLTNVGGIESGEIEVVSTGDVSAFTVESDGCGNARLQPEQSCTYQLRFTPPEAGSFSMAVQFAGNPGGTATVSVTGRSASPVTLDIEVVSGSGRVVIDDLVDCADSCSVVLGEGAQVELRAVPAGGWGFVSWTGACSGSAPTCQLQLDEDTAVGATFEERDSFVRITVENVFWAEGQVVAGETLCEDECTLSIPFGQELTLVAELAPSVDYVTFVGWTGACEDSTDFTCTVQVESDLDIRAVFSPLNHAFITTGQYPLADLTPEVADGICNQENLDWENLGFGPTGVTYMAWLSAPGQSARERLEATGARGWVRPDGRPIADTLAALLEEGELYIPIDRDRANDRVYGAVVTGTTREGGTALTCDGWQGNGWATSGSTDFVYGAWTDEGMLACSESAHLYCFGTTFAAPIRKPEVPSFSKVAFVSSVPFIPSSGAAAADQLCAQEAQSAGWTGRQFHALLATQTESIADRLAWVLPTHRADGFPLSNDGEGDADVLNVTADGRYLDVEVWTGAGDIVAPGTPEVTCNNWTTTSGEAVIGRVASVEDLLTSGTTHCSRTDVHLLCVEARDDMEPGSD